ncbi:MAG: acylglycerol kinase family protein, partial [Verrucomicrobiota bacterium]|nr:acylglycerol kinase family protein [Verrucomicrobiota bacterium]
MKTCLICNPGAGNVDDTQALEEKLRRFANASIHFTKEAGDATRLAKAALDDGCTTIIAAGGDGTLNEVINGIAPHASDAIVGLLPLGTGNDFARMLGLPDSLDDCIDVLRAGATRPTDLVRVSSDQV